MTGSRTITDDARRARLAHRHRLVADRRIDDVSRIVDDLVALHSSDPATVYLSAVVRMTSPTISAVEQALYEERSIVRHHAMRRTMWVMTRETGRRAHGAATSTIATAERKRTLDALASSPDIADPDRAFRYAQIRRLAPPRPPANLGQKLFGSTWSLADARKLELPILIITGTYDIIFPPRLMRGLHAELPSSKLVEIENAGHSPYFERPAAWNEIVLDHIGR